MSWQEEFQKNLIKVLYDPNQPRNKHGRWISGGRNPNSSISSEKGVSGRSDSITENEKQFQASMERFRSFTSSHIPKNDLTYQGIYDMVLKEGRWFDAPEGEKLPKGVRRGQAKECFKNAAHLALESEEYTYVEGFAMSRVIPELPIQHAWVVNKKGQVIDNTWPAGDGQAYLGIPFSVKHLSRTLSETEMYGMIPEIPIGKYNPMKNGFPEDAIVKTNAPFFVNVMDYKTLQLQSFAQSIHSYCPGQRIYWDLKYLLDNGKGIEKVKNWEDKFQERVSIVLGDSLLGVFQRNLKEIILNYRQDQPRWPKGHPQGGKWMSLKGADGTFSVADYPKDVKDITEEMAMFQADYADISAKMQNNLKEISTGKHQSNKVEIKGGAVDESSAKDITNNMKQELADYSGYLAGDAALRARDYIDSFEDSLNKGVRDGSLEGISAKDLDALGQDNIKKLMYQEIESNRQQFTDHGIRHITGNVLRQKEIMRTMQPGVTGREELMGDFIMMNHDVGYTVPLVREGGLRGVMMSGQHPKFSEKIAQQQKSIWDEDKIFSSKEYDKMTGIIRTHDSTVIDKKDWLTTSTRLSDNLSLFNGEKLPSMFKYVPGGDKHLIAMGLASAKKNTGAFEKQRKLLYDRIDASDLSQNLKRDLKAATKEISYVSPKFTLGVLAGDISKISKNNGKLNVKIAYNKYDKFLQKHFDMGQKQTKKLLNDYGITDFSKTKYTIGDVVELEVIGAPKK